MKPDISQLIALAEIHQLVLDVIAEMSVPREICHCTHPMVSEPDYLDWCTCMACRRYVPMTAVVDQKATVYRQCNA